MLKLERNFRQSLGRTMIEEIRRVRAGRRVTTTRATPVGSDTFRMVSPPGPKQSLSVAVYHPGDDAHSSAIERGKVQAPAADKAGATQQIEFPRIADRKDDAAPADAAIT